MLETGTIFVLDRDSTPGDATRVELPHREIFEAIEPAARLLLDDGKLVLRVIEHDDARIVTRVEVGGALSNNKGLNVPDVVVSMAALTDKDRIEQIGRAHDCTPVTIAHRVCRRLLEHKNQ